MSKNNEEKMENEVNEKKSENIEIIFEDEIENTNNETSKSNEKKHGRRSARIENNKKDKKTKKNGKKKMPRKKKIIIALSIFLVIIIILGVVFGVYIYKADGDVTSAVLNMASDIVGEQDPIFVLVLGISEDISVELTDTIMLCAYNPQSQKAYMLSIPRDTFVGKSTASANSYDKINALYQTSAEKTVEAVELLTGVTIDYYVIVRNISITSIYECIGSVDFDVPIDMDYDDPTQDLHIHLEAGYQTLEPDQIEQLLRFRHNNDGTSYPSEYGNNDYGRMRTQREFLAATLDQLLTIQNVSKIKDIVSMVYTNLQTNMSGYTALEYVPYGLQFDTSNLMSEQLPGQSGMINELSFYLCSKSQTRELMDELMIYLELDDETLESHYAYASAIKGVSPDENYVLNEVIKDEVYTTTSSSKNTTANTTTTNTNTEDTSSTHTHTYSTISDSATCTEGGTLIQMCTICGDTVYSSSSAKGHTWGSWVTTQAATTTSTGTQTRTCSTCGATESQTIAQLIETTTTDTGTTTDTSQETNTGTTDTGSDASGDTSSDTTTETQTEGIEESSSASSTNATE